MTDETRYLYYPNVTRSVFAEEHYRNGRLQDPDDGRPAMRVYHSDGSVKGEWHYHNGQEKKIYPKQ